MPKDGDLDLLQSRCTTFFGRFGLGDDNRQEDHQILVVQWQKGVKRIVWPPSLAEASPIL